MKNGALIREGLAKRNPTNRGLIAAPVVRATPPRFSISAPERISILLTSFKNASRLLFTGRHGAPPTMGGCQVKSELVQDSQDGLIDEVIDGLRMIVKCRNGRKNHDAHARELQHIFEVNVTQRRFADGQH